MRSPSAILSLRAQIEGIGRRHWRAGAVLPHEGAIEAPRGP